MAATFEGVAFSAMQTTARIPSIDAASATPCAWLPAEEHTTPRARSSSERRESLLSGPRILYEPVRWNSSALSRTSRPVSSSSALDVSRGVRCTNGVTFSRAATESGRAAVLIPAILTDSGGEGGEPQPPPSLIRG